MDNICTIVRPILDFTLNLRWRARSARGEVSIDIFKYRDRNTRETELKNSDRANNIRDKVRSRGVEDAELHPRPAAVRLYQSVVHGYSGKVMVY